MVRHERSEAGFSVVELVVSSAILLSVLVSTMTVVGFASTSSGRTSQRDRAINIASTVIERARNMPFDAVGVRYATGGYGEPPGEIVTPDSTTYPGFTVTTAISWVNSGGRAAYKEMKVSVAWQAPEAGDVSLETGIFGATDLVNVGDLRVTVIDADTDLPIFRALVTVDPFDVAAPRTVATAADGVAVFGRADQGPAVVTVSAGGYLFDDSLTAAVPIDRDLTSELTVYGHLASTVGVTVRDAAGPVAGATVTLTDPHGIARTAVTGADGVAPPFIGMLPATYGLGASLGSRRAEQSSVAITHGGQTVACEITLPVAVPSGQLRISTRDATTLKALSGVTLTLLDSQGVAAAGSPTATVAGQALWPALAPGAYTLSATLSGYKSASGIGVTVVSGQPNACTLDLVPVAATTGTIRAVVTDATGHALKNRWVYLRYPDGRQASLKTPSTGTVEWTALPIGSYTLWLDGHTEAPQQASPGNPYTVLTFVDR